jgi:hypothetical protein
MRLSRKMPRDLSERQTMRAVPADFQSTHLHADFQLTHPTLAVTLPGL